VSRALDEIYSIFSKSNSNQFTPNDVKAIEKLVPLVGPDEEQALAMVWEGISLIRDDLTNENFNPKSAKKIKERIKRLEGDKKS